MDLAERVSSLSLSYNHTSNTHIIQSVEFSLVNSQINFKIIILPQVTLYTEVLQARVTGSC